ncbi:MAG: ABC transporter ATP-binding protein [Verrucomicrobiota bacterium JB022]|nr:ABC transporter ATP-binding protein [Verrucomicrobiota bacterium JB022]
MSEPTPPPIPPEQPALIAKGLYRSFGDVKAVQDVSFTLPRGSVTGFIGTNGSGKTTTLRLLATLDFPDAGRIVVEGIDALLYPRVVRARIGWMPDTFGGYPNLSVVEYLEFFGRAYGMPQPQRDTRIAQVVEFVGLQGLVKRPCTKLSKGEAQRVSLARMLLQDPSVLLLDEPAAGLDPRARVEFRNLILALRNQGKTLLLSSHILADLEAICDQLIFINQGKIIHSGTTESVHAKAQPGQRIRVRLTAKAAEWREWVQLQPAMALQEEHLDGGIVLLETTGTEAARDLLHRSILAGFPVHEFRQVEARLEDAFMHLIQPTELPTTPPPLPQ